MVTVITQPRVLPEQPQNMPTTRNSCNNPMATVIEKLDHVLSTSETRLFFGADDGSPWLSAGCYQSQTPSGGIVSTSDAR